MTVFTETWLTEHDDDEGLSVVASGMHQLDSNMEVVRDTQGAVCVFTSKRDPVLQWLRERICTLDV